MTLVEKAQVALAVIGGLALLTAIMQVLLTQASERRRTQPIVVAHEVEPRRPEPERSRWSPQVRVKNEGQGAAFNVRFGVAYFHARFSFRLNEDDPYSGNRQRVMHPREEVGPRPIYVPTLELWGGRGVPEEGAFYWARYQNAQGKTWETRNPPERSADLRIKRVRFVGFRERLEARGRKDLGAEGRKREREILHELREAMRGDDEAPM